MEHISREKHDMMSLPQMTLCLLPGLKLPPTINPYYATLDLVCPNTTYYQSCLENLTYTREEVFQSVSLGYEEDLNYDEYWIEQPLDFVFGRCFTFNYETKFEVGGLKNIFAIFFQKLSPSVNVMIAIHETDEYIPAYTVDKDGFLSQKHYYFQPKNDTMIEISTHLSRRERMNTPGEKKICNPDPNYRVSKCFKKVAQKQAGCISPWEQREQVSVEYHR